MPVAYKELFCQSPRLLVNAAAVPPVLISPSPNPFYLLPDFFPHFLSQFLFLLLFSVLSQNPYHGLSFAVVSIINPALCRYSMDLYGIPWFCSKIIVILLSINFSNSYFPLLFFFHFLHNKDNEKGGHEPEEMEYWGKY